jgi:hypothetical protein
VSNLHVGGVRLRLGSLAAGALALGCSLFSTQAYLLAEGAPTSAEFRRLVLLPLNFDRSPSPQLALGVEEMGERMRGYLEQRGFEVVSPAMSSTLAVWRQCEQQVGGLAAGEGREVDIDRYESARSELVRRVLEAISADGVVAGAVMIREAQYSGQFLRWDGASRRVSIDMGNTNMPVLALRGKDAGTSLRTSVFDRSGRKIFERYVGMEPMRSYKVKYPRVQVVERRDLFQDEALLDEVVQLSFQPWMPPPGDVAP